MPTTTAPIATTIIRSGRAICLLCFFYAAPLLATNWSTVTTGTFGSSAVNYTNNAPTDAQRFYRITSP